MKIYFRGRRESISPKRTHRNKSPPYYKNYYKSRDRSPSKERKIEKIQETLQRLAGIDTYKKQSPLSSPLHGFRRSVADSTISDDQLLQHNVEEYTESPINVFEPKRMSLDERINMALGIPELQPKPISTIASNYEYNKPYFDEYGQYYQHYSTPEPRKQEESNVKVVRVGNVLQVVPTEDLTTKKPAVQQNKVQ